VHESRVAARGALDHSLEDQAVARAIALQEHFERSASLSLLLANDSALKAYAGANRVAPGRPAPAQMSPAAGRALAYLQQLYPGRITAASLLDRFGTEHARAVRGIVTPADRLSYSSTRGSFFEPTLALSPGHVHHAVPYRSPSTDQWVLPSSTPVFRRGRARLGHGAPRDAARRLPHGGARDRDRSRRLVVRRGGPDGTGPAGVGPARVPRLRHRAART
jgi:hypothetical protein